MSRDESADKVSRWLDDDLFIVPLTIGLVALGAAINGAVGVFAGLFGGLAYGVVRELRHGRREDV